MNTVVEGIKGFWSKVPSFRDFRTSAVVIGVLLYMALKHVLGITIVDGYPGGLVDGTLIGIVFTAYATALMKLSDDGGESDAVKIVKMFLEKENK